MEKNKFRDFERSSTESENIISKNSFENLSERSYSSFHFGFKTKCISHQEIKKLLKFIMNIIFSEEKKEKSAFVKNIIK